VAVKLTVNGTTHADVPPGRRLLDWIRDDLQLHGTKEGCGAGHCGACTVLVDGEPTLSCSVLVGMADGGEVRTVEGLADDRAAAALISTLTRDRVFQCGFCSAGMTVAAIALLRRDPEPSEATVCDALAGNLCRCTGYARIVETLRSPKEVPADE
jgi:carbon-monoxide dehydrogenase small subunit